MYDQWDYPYVFITVLEYSSSLGSEGINTENEQVLYDEGAGTIQKLGDLEIGGTQRNYHGLTVESSEIFL